MDNAAESLAHPSRRSCWSWDHRASHLPPLGGGVAARLFSTTNESRSIRERDDIRMHAFLQDRKKNAVDHAGDIAVRS